MARIEDIGIDLVVARRALGVTQRELGARLGVTQPQIARWEASGYRSASLGRVGRIAKELGYEISAASTMLAAEQHAAYHASVPNRQAGMRGPVRDLGEVTARLRAHGTELRTEYRLDRIGVFGSFVTGRQTPQSDVDLLVETDDPGGFRYVSAALRAEQILQRSVDFVRPERLKDRLRERVLDEVVYVWHA